MRTKSAGEADVEGLMRVSGLFPERGQIRLSVSSALPDELGLQLIGRPSFKACDEVQFGPPVSGQILSPTAQFTIPIQDGVQDRVQDGIQDGVGKEVEGEDAEGEEMEEEAEMECGEVCVTPFFRIREPGSTRRAFYTAEQECWNFQAVRNQTLLEQAARNWTQNNSTSSAAFTTSQSTPPSSSRSSASSTSPPTPPTTTKPSTAATATSTTTTTSKPSTVTILITPRRKTTQRILAAGQGAGGEGSTEKKKKAGTQATLCVCLSALTLLLLF